MCHSSAFRVYHPGSKNTRKLLYLSAFWEGACAASEMSMEVLDMGQAEPFSGGVRGEHWDPSPPGRDLLMRTFKWEPA